LVRAFANRTTAVWNRRRGQAIIHRMNALADLSFPVDRFPSVRR